MTPRIHDSEEKQARLVTELAQARAQKAEAEAAYKTKQEEQAVEIEPLKADRDEKAAKVERLETEIKAYGLTIPQAEWHPALIPAHTNIIEYDDAEMFRFCVIYNPSLFELRRSNITQEVNHIMGSVGLTKKYFGKDGEPPVIPMPVRVERIPVVNLKDDLSQWLPTPEPEVPAEPEPVIVETVATSPEVAVEVQEAK